MSVKPPYARRFGRVDAFHTTYDLHLVDGCVINNVKVVHVPRRHSHFYDETTDGPNTRMHIEGEVRCKCLICGRTFTVGYHRLSVNHPERSIWSCGCQRRPYGIGIKNDPDAPREDVRRGRAPKDITDQRFGSLEPVHWIPYKGWLCLCHQCGNTDGCVVPEARLLTRGTVTACKRCRPGEWRNRKRGRRKAAA